MPTALNAPESLTGDLCYLAMKAHDARFDGSFFTAVTSTGIYCRPVCRVRLPKRENCRFFAHAAQAEAEGFRPCLRCRPELAPRKMHWSTEDASRMLALQAARLIDDPEAWEHGSVRPVPAFGVESSSASVEVDARRSMQAAADSPADGPSIIQVAERLGVSDRHLRRIFEAQFGVSPLQYLQTRRLLIAKQLIADTRLPMAQVAASSGFASVRRFNAAFAAHYGMNPSALRRAGGDAVETTQGVTVRLGFRPPYDSAAMLAFFERAALRSVEATIGTGPSARFARTLRIDQGAQSYAGWLQFGFDLARDQLLLSVSDSLTPVLPIVIHRTRAMFDLDADPMAINAMLAPHFPDSDGLRVPGAIDGFELAVRVILGQQITVAAARTVTSRLVETFGEPLTTPIAGLTRLFPTPAALAAASSDALGLMGIVRQRQVAIKMLAAEVALGRIELHTGTDVRKTLAALQALPGIGDWTAQSIAMRALRWPDAFPAGDIALQKALGVTGAKAAAEASRAWQPWRAYAVIRAWHTLPYAITSIAEKLTATGATA